MPNINFSPDSVDPGVAMPTFDHAYNIRKLFMVRMPSEGCCANFFEIILE